MAEVNNDYNGHLTITFTSLNGPKLVDKAALICDLLLKTN